MPCTRQSCSHLKSETALPTSECILGTYMQYPSTRTYLAMVRNTRSLLRGILPISSCFARHFNVSSSTLLCRNGGVSFSHQEVIPFEMLVLDTYHVWLLQLKAISFEFMYLDWVDRDGARWLTCLRSLELILDEDVPSSVGRYIARRNAAPARQIEMFCF